MAGSGGSEVVAALHTIGYEGRDLDTFVGLLRRGRVDVLVDVRRTARSRNVAFSKTALREALGRGGIEYVHIPELGVDRDAREALKRTGDFEGYERGYLLYLRKQREALRYLHALVTERSCCLMCVEHEPDRCHRSVLAARVSALNGEPIPIVNL
jgi:uncharacterized protein (DUF488 family)